MPNLGKIKIKARKIPLEKPRKLWVYKWFPTNSRGFFVNLAQLFFFFAKTLVFGLGFKTWGDSKKIFAWGFFKSGGFSGFSKVENKNLLEKMKLWPPHHEQKKKNCFLLKKKFESWRGVGNLSEKKEIFFFPWKQGFVCFGGGFPEKKKSSPPFGKYFFLVVEWKLNCGVLFGSGGRGRNKFP